MRKTTSRQWREVARRLNSRHWFGPKSLRSKTGDRAGDVAVVRMRVAQPVPPGEQQVVQFGQVAGDASFSAVEGERFVVTEANWNEPFAAVVQVDAKLDHPSEATFEIRSGNLPLAWSVTFFVVAGGVLWRFAIYHFVALPRPAGDSSRRRQRSMTRAS